MERSEIRYICFSLFTEAEKGKDIPPPPVGFRETFESQEAFRGWLGFGVTWDIDEDDHWKAVPRECSLLEEWHRELARKVPVLTEDGIVSAEEWNAMQEAETTE